LQNDEWNPVAETPIPPVGLGTWKIEKPDVSRVVRDAVACGYRHFDCACDYGNEAEVGIGLQQAFEESVCAREDVWVTSKLWNTYHAAEHVRPAIERSLQDLRLDSLDLYLVHFPIPLKYVPFETRYPPEWVYDPAAEHPRMELASVPFHETWRAMEQLVRDGLTRRIGLCNVNTAFLRDLLTYAEIRPSLLQVELHPYLTQPNLVRFCHEQQIAVTAFSPLGASSYLSLDMATADEDVLAEPVIRELARKYEKTPAQIVLKWGIQRGTAVIPKTSRADRLQENISLFDFELSDEDLCAISSLNRNRRFNDPGQFCEPAFGTFCPIFD